ncbi:MULTISPECIES: permease [unclassified Synechocystis]|uniref:permease n=1 Tax=unclassified Synechocystis TaxID=2640012 RepID=UPI000409FF34|nr:MULTISPECIES: permease [unclassified Synechocystis]AIE73760.1 Transporter [Synechocystis sp. PCC 6714]MCT0252412.1 permease [Synechocystis sp. CS-94]
MTNLASFNLFFNLLGSALLLSLPWLLLGIIISSTFLIWTDEQKWVANFPRNRLLSSLVGSALGVLLPLGAVGSVPLVRRLLLQGAPIPLVISFLVAAPTLNFFAIVRILSSPQSQYGLIFLCISFTWLMAIVMGLVFSPYRLARQQTEEEETALVNIPLLRSGALIVLESSMDTSPRQGGLVFASGVNPVADFSWPQKLYLFGRNIIEEFQEFGGVLVIGTAIACGITLFLPQEWLLQWAGLGPVRQTILMMGWSLILPLGNFSDPDLLTPLADQLWRGSMVGFLLLGSIFNLQTIGLWLVTLRLRPLSYLLILVGLSVFLFAMVTNYYLT